jgi:hypothetical protein
VRRNKVVPLYPGEASTPLRRRSSLFLSCPHKRRTAIGEVRWSAISLTLSGAPEFTAYAWPEETREGSITTSEPYRISEVPLSGEVDLEHIPGEYSVSRALSSTRPPDRRSHTTSERTNIYRRGSRSRILCSVLCQSPTRSIWRTWNWQTTDSHNLTSSEEGFERSSRWK